MATRLLGARLNLLSAREVLNARDKELSDGGGLLLRCSGERAAWVFRYTSATGKRREMGLGACVRHNAKAAGESLALARDLAAKQRALLAADPPLDPDRRAGQGRRRPARGRTATQGREEAGEGDARPRCPCLSREIHRAANAPEALGGLDQLSGEPRSAGALAQADSGDHAGRAARIPPRHAAANGRHRAARPSATGRGIRRGDRAGDGSRQPGGDAAGEAPSGAQAAAPHPASRARLPRRAGFRRRATGAAGHRGALPRVHDPHGRAHRRKHRREMVRVRPERCAMDRSGRADEGGRAAHSPSVRAGARDPGRDAGAWFALRISFRSTPAARSRTWRCSRCSSG